MTAFEIFAAINFFCMGFNAAMIACSLIALGEAKNPAAIRFWLVLGNLLVLAASFITYLT